MDVLTKWFQFSLGVEPNKATLQNLAQGVNDYIQALSSGQQALAQYASTASPEQFLSSTPLSAGEKQKLIEQYVSSPQGKQELDKQLRKQEKAARQPIIWQIPEEKMNELKWQRTQLLRVQAAQRAKMAGGGKAKVVPKVVQGGAKRVGPQKQIPKLAPSKASSVAGGPPKKPTTPTNQAQKKNLPNGTPKAPNAKPPTVAKAAPKTNGVAKPKAK
ncbi:MAG: hypothetical protein LQ350_005723 [Teloschistes chrysophthalmus]|nr:MAG: hypothetical protein LQ350_005723 [Niorma chrysophthalma]